MENLGTSIKSKHVILTEFLKLEIIMRIEEGGNMQDIMKELNNGSPTIYDIKKN